MPIKKLLNNIKKDHISEYSAQCAYYVILSFIPFVILLLTIIQYTSIEQQQLLDIMSKIIPSSMSEMVLGIVREVYSKSVGTVSISLIFTLISADKGLFALVKGLHSIYKYKDNKEKSIIYLKLTSIIKTMIFIILVAIGAVILVFGKTIVSTIQEKFGLLGSYTIISQIFTQMIFLIVIFLLFLCLYKFMPGHKITFKSQIFGAIFSSIALTVISFVFSRFLDIFKGFSITYGSLTALMLLMMWTYACFYAIFLGAEINKLENDKFRYKRDSSKKGNMIKRYSSNELQKLAKILKEDGIISVPTDTVYGLCARICSKDAQKKLIEVKNRPKNKVFPIMCADKEQIKSIAILDEKAEKIIDKFMPGPITLILKKKPELPQYINNGMETVAIRMATSDILKKLINEVGCPIFMSSANQSGKKVCTNLDEIEKTCPDIDGMLEGNVIFGESSTIVDCTLDDVKIVREGPISLEQIIGLK